MQEWSLDNIGLSKLQKRFLDERVLPIAEGFILVVAPPNEGRHTTGTYLINKLAKLHRHKMLITVENPIRYNLESVLQFQIDPDTSYSYYFEPIVFRGPNVVYIDNIADEETAKKVLESTHYFELVVATLEASNVHDAITKLTNMDIPKRNLIGSLDLIISQRLIKRLCEKCVKTFDPLEEEIPYLEQHIKKLKWNREVHFSRGSGKDTEGNTCTACQGTGYNGKVGIFEIFKFSTRLMELVDCNANVDEIEEQIEKEGFPLLWYNGLEKALNEETTLEELINVLGYPKRLDTPIDADF